MPEYDPDTEAATYAELDNLTNAYRAAEASLEAAREALRASIVVHLRERHAPPGKIAEHTPYDRNHVGRIARDGGVEPSRPPTVRSIRQPRRPRLNPEG